MKGILALTAAISLASASAEAVTNPLRALVARGADAGASGADAGATDADTPSPADLEALRTWIAARAPPEFALLDDSDSSDLIEKRWHFPHAPSWANPAQIGRWGKAAGQNALKYVKNVGGPLMNVGVKSVLSRRDLADLGVDLDDGWGADGPDTFEDDGLPAAMLARRGGPLNLDLEGISDEDLVTLAAGLTDSSENGLVARNVGAGTGDVVEKRFLPLVLPVAAFAGRMIAQEAAIRGAEQAYKWWKKNHHKRDLYDGDDDEDGVYGILARALDGYNGAGELDLSGFDEDAEDVDIASLIGGDDRKLGRRDAEDEEELDDAEGEMNIDPAELEGLARRQEEELEDAEGLTDIDPAELEGLERRQDVVVVVDEAAVVSDGGDVDDEPADTHWKRSRIARAFKA